MQLQQQRANYGGISWKT